MKNRTDLPLGEAVYISIMFYSCPNYLIITSFIFHAIRVKTAIAILAASYKVAIIEIKAVVLSKSGISWVFLSGTLISVFGTIMKWS